MTELIEKKDAAAAKPVSKTTAARKAPSHDQWFTQRPRIATMTNSYVMGKPEPAPVTVAPRAAAPRRAVAKVAYIELSGDDVRPLLSYMPFSSVRAEMMYHTVSSVVLFRTTPVLDVSGYKSIEVLAHGFALMLLTIKLC